ncbi:MAG: PEGA domain-containing protein, partial [Alistipes sp.]|nr:PEGA domain-containing protein [Alistipes sp.]
MKRLFAIFVALCAAFVAVAQSENSIIIDQNSFRPLQSDALTGVNIDPIGVDSSRRPCARIKMKINRMSREDIDKLDVKIVTNNQLTKCKTADYENGLILEMTAKPATRFYLNHPEFGQSNEVTLNLEPNKEYYMEASLNQTYSIVVNSNVTDAEVYLDGVFKGRTDSSNSLTIKGVFAGEHTLELTYGNVSHEQKIEVNSSKISFRQNVDIAASEPQFVVFTVEPQSAVVTIDGKHYTLQDGAMRVVLDGGTYNYTVTAVGYHSKSGTFTVAGEKVTKSISLTADVANVTLTAPNDADIWINGEKKGRGSWSGRLTAGAYIFEAKKEGYRTATLSKHITSAQPQQSYTLPAPTPIYGSIMVDGNPINAYVILDDKGVGQIPLKLNNVLIGNHTLKISKAGYKDYTQTITISEGKTTTVNATLEKYITTVPQTTTNVPSGESLAIVVNTNVAGAEVYI